MKTYTLFHSLKLTLVLLTLSLTLGVGNVWGATYTFDCHSSTSGNGGAMTYWYSDAECNTHVCKYYSTSNPTTHYNRWSSAYTMYYKDATITSAKTFVMCATNSNYAYFANGAYLIFGKTNSYLTLPTFSNEKITNIAVTTNSSVAGDVQLNVYSGSNTASTQRTTTGSKVEVLSFDITNTYQNDELKIQIGNNKNIQLTQIVITTAPSCTKLGQINGSINWSNGTEAILTWDNLDHVASYAVTYKTGAGDYVSTNVGDISTNGAGKKTCSITGLTPGTAYTFKIAATAASGYCDNSQEITATAPLITASGTIDGLNYAEGSGASTAKTFTVSGVGLTGDITVTAPTNFEVSKSSDSGYGSSVSLSPTSGTLAGSTVYVRLAEDKSVGTYNGNITISGGGAANNTGVSVSGVVSVACHDPNITGQPVASTTYNLNATATALSVTAAKGNAGDPTLTYQWYSNTANSKTTPEPTLISEATSSTYTPPTTSTGTVYYFCEVSSGICSTTSNIAAVTVNTPTLTVSETSRAFGERAINGSYTMTFTVSGANLAKDAGISLALSGTNATLFSIDKTSLSATANAVASTTITVTYSPNAVGSHSATITISSTGAANQTVALSGSVSNYTLTWATVRGKIITAGTGAAVDATGSPSSSVAHGAAITAPVAGGSNGYTFTGWSPTPAATMPAANTTYTAQWSANVYTVTLNNQSATTAGAASVSATFGQTMPSIAGNLPERTGYSFGGYFTNTNGGGTKYYNADGTSATNMALYGATPTLYAYWIAQISFSVNGNIISTQAVTAALPSSATVPTSCGDCWAFAGWSTNSECSTAPEHAGGENAATHGITTPTTLYAVYRKGETSEYSTEPSCPTYTITWVVNGETYSTGTPTTSTNECTGITTLPTAPSNSTLSCADKFMGWSESTLTGTGNDAPDDLFTNAAGAPTIDENKTFYAVFASIDDENTTTETDNLTCTLTGITGTAYTSWSGKSNNSSAVYAGKSSESQTNKVIQIKSSGSNTGLITTTSGGLAKKITITWSNENTSGRTISIYGKNSAYSAPTDLFSETASTQGASLGNIVYGTSTELTITGDYAFIGIRSSSGAAYLTNVAIQWENAAYKDYVTGCCPAYTITGATTSGTAVSGGTLTSTNNSSCEGNDVKITATVNTGYRFNGWDITSGGSTVARKDGSAETEDGKPIYIFTMPAGNVTVSATITLRTATVTLGANSGTGDDQTVTATYGTAMPLTTTSDVAIAVPTKTGAKLLGYWDTDASSGGTQYYAYDGSTLSSARAWDKEVGDVTLYARWLTVDYYIDDMHGTTGYTGAGMEKSGAGYTVPGPIDENKTGNVCETEHYIFVGWVSADGQNTDGTLKGTPTIVQPGEVKNASGTTYYAVWAEE